MTLAGAALRWRLTRMGVRAGWLPWVTMTPVSAVAASASPVAVATPALTLTAPPVAVTVALSAWPVAVATPAVAPTLMLTTLAVPVAAAAALAVAPMLTLPALAAPVAVAT